MSSVISRKKTLEGSEAEIMSVMIPVIPFKIDREKKKSCLVKVLNARDIGQ